VSAALEKNYERKTSFKRKDSKLRKKRVSASREREVWRQFRKGSPIKKRFAGGGITEGKLLL